MLFTANNELAIAAPQSESDVSSWKVTTKKGTQSGVGVAVSGAGAWARLTGEMRFQIVNLESSKTYDMMKKEYNIGGGVSAFWSWLGIKANASTHKEEIHQTFKELSQTQKVDGQAQFDLQVTGLYPNVEVQASAYILILQITDSSGNTYNIASNGDPSADTGAQDSQGQTLPNKDNNSTISL